jgi:hypothetical protein
MLRTRTTRVLVLLLLAAFFNTPWMSAQGLSGPTVEVHAALGLWAWLARTLQKEGCSLDPNGKFCPHNSVHSTDNGCSLDPNGCSSFGPKLDAGCTLDPDGRCVR